MTANPAGFQEFRARHPRLTALPGGRAPAPLPASPGPFFEEEAAPTSEVFSTGGRAGSKSIDAASQDDVLSVAACAGNPHAAAIITRRYAERVRWKLHRLIGSQDIDDHVQDVFVRLFEQLPRMRDPGALRGFLTGITFRIACTELRRRRRSRMSVTATGELPEPSASQGDNGPAQEAVWRLEAILEELAPRSRRVFVLRYIEKLELTEVALQARISVATAKRHLARAAATVSAMVKREPALAEYLTLRCAPLEPRFIPMA
jgi:RNA polymerase sigma-70 factor (ECF subfamily)